MTEVSYFKKASSNAFFIFFFGILMSFVGYLLRLVLTSNLSPTDYALFYSCLSLIWFFAIFKELGLTDSLVYHISKFSAERNLKKLRTSIISVFIIQIIPGLIITISLFIFSEFLAINYLHLSSDLVKGVLVIRLLAITYFIQVIYNILLSILRGFQKMKFYSFIDFCRELVWFGSTYIFILLNFSTLSPSMGFLGSYIIIILLFSLFILKLIPKVKLKFSKDLTKKLILYGLPVMLSTMAGVIIGHTDTLLITFFRTLEEVGIYQTAQPTARLLWFFAGAFATVLFPLVTELKTRKKEGIETGVTLIYKYIWVLIIPFALMGFAFSSEILGLFFGSFYAGGAGVLKILVVGALFYSITQINGAVLNGLGKPKYYTKIIYVGVVINLIGNIILIPKLGITGAALSTLFSYMVMFSFSFFEVGKFLDIKLPLLDWVKTLIIGFISLLLIYFIKEILFINLFLEIFVCFSTSLLVFFCLLIFFNIINPKDIIKLIKDLLRK